MVSEFRQTVFDALVKVPEGKVTTYANLARAINWGSSQAIGQALKFNPFAPQVPCHRVIKSDLTIGGFHGQTSGPHIERKLELLRSEGVEVENGRVPSRYIFDFNQFLVQICFQGERYVRVIDENEIFRQILSQLYLQDDEHTSINPLTRPLEWFPTILPSSP